MLVLCVCNQFQDEEVVLQTPSSSSALQSYLTSLPLILHRHPHTPLTILLGLIDLESIEKELKPRDQTNILFEEDPLNNYLEEMVVISAAGAALETLLSHHTTELLSTVESLIELIRRVTTALESKRSIQVQFSPWNERNIFLGLSKVSLVSRAVTNGMKRAGSHVKLPNFNIKLLLLS